MRATLTVNAQEGSSAPYKVTVKLWNVPRQMGRQIGRACVREGDTFRRGLLGGQVDVIYNPQDKSVTLVKPAHTTHGLQGQFDALVGKSLAYRIREAREAAREAATKENYDPYEGNLKGCSVHDIYNTILQAVRTEASPKAAASGAKPKRRRPRPVGVTV